MGDGSRCAYDLSHDERLLAQTGSRVDVSLIAFGALIGLLVGLTAGLAYRFSDRAIRPPVPERDAGLPEGVAQVLGVLRSLAVVLDGSDQVIKASPAASAFGIVRAERLVVEELADLVANVRRDGRIRGVELELPRGPVGGGTLAVSARVAPLGMSHVLVLIEDQTDARRVDAIRRDFVANVSHELKTPVGALRLLAEAVQDASDDPEAVVRFAGRMQHESMRLSHLVQELIDLSRLESRDPLKDAQPVGVDVVVDAAIDRTHELATAKGIEITDHGEKGLKIFGSEAQLTMALGNLIENAVNYSAGKTRVGVTVRRERRSCRDLRDRPGHRYPGRRAATHLRAVLPGRPGPLAGDRRHRPGPVHRQAHRPEPRRRRPGVERGGFRLHVHPASAAADVCLRHRPAATG